MHFDSARGSVLLTTMSQLSQRDMQPLANAASAAHDTNPCQQQALSLPTLCVTLCEHDRCHHGGADCDPRYIGMTAGGGNTGMSVLWNKSQLCTRGRVGRRWRGHAWVRGGPQPAVHAAWCRCDSRSHAVSTQRSPCCGALKGTTSAFRPPRRGPAKGNTGKRLHFCALDFPAIPKIPVARAPCLYYPTPSRGANGRAPSLIYSIRSDCTLRVPLVLQGRTGLLQHTGMPRSPRDSA